MGKGFKTFRRVKTAAEVLAHFKERLEELDAIATRRLDELGVEGMKEEARKRTVQNPDGSRSVQMSDYTVALFKLQREMFKYKFGREMGPEDYIFFDLEADTPGPMDPTKSMASFVRACRDAGVDPKQAAAVIGQGWDEELEDYQRNQH